MMKFLSLINFLYIKQFNSIVYFFFHYIMNEKKKIKSDLAIFCKKNLDLKDEDTFKNKINNYSLSYPKNKDKKVNHHYGYFMVKILSSIDLIT